MFCPNKRFYELKVGGGANYALCHNHSLNLHYKAHQLTCYKDSQNSTLLQDKIQKRNNSLNITNICLGSISWLKEFRIRKGCIQRDLKEDRIATEHSTERKSSGEQDIVHMHSKWV